MSDGDPIPDLRADNKKDIVLHTGGQITGFAGLVQHHLTADLATRDARIMVGARSILLEGYRPFPFGSGGPITAADFVIL